MDRLETKKKELEIQILERQLLPESKVDSHLNSIKKWIGVVLIIISVPGTIWGVYLPIRSYWITKEKEVKYSLTSPMINLVSKLKSKTEVEREEALMLLAYYEMNSFDILHFILENHEGDSPGFIERIADALNEVYQRGHHSVFEKLRDSFMLIIQNNLGSEEKAQENQALLYRYVIVVKKFKLSAKHYNQREELLNSLSSSIRNYESMAALIDFLKDEN